VTQSKQKLSTTHSSLMSLTFICMVT